MLDGMIHIKPVILDVHSQASPLWKKMKKGPQLGPEGGGA